MWMKTLGVDLLSGSVNSKVQPRYSVVLLEDGEMTRREEVSRYKLIRLIRNERPERIACDNVYELFKKNRAKGFFYRLPQETRLVQVNGSPQAQEPLHIVAKRHGLHLTSRASSMEEAEACAILASRSVGYTAEMFTDECRIVVSRARSMGKGGQSQDRYRRKVHEAVGQKIKEVECVLKEKGLSYELSRVKADYGYSRGEFRVRAPSGVLKGIKRSRGPDVQVKKLRVEREGLEFVPGSVKEKGVIVGIDPGTTAGVAVLDLDGELCEVLSARDFSVNDAISHLTKYREVIIVASDVTPAPRFVEKVSSSLSSVLYTPPKPLTVQDKKELVVLKFSRDAYRNPHERDALAAALKAYNHYRNKLDHVERRLAELSLQRHEGEVKRMVIEGRSIDRAIKALTVTEEDKKEAARIEAEAPKEYRALIRTLREEIRVLKEEVEGLTKALKTRDGKIRALMGKLRDAREGELQKVIRKKEIKRGDREIAALKAKLGREKEMRQTLQEKLNRLRRSRLVEYSENLVLVKVISKFTREEINRARERIKNSDVIYLPDPAGGGRATAEKLLELEPKVLIAEKRRISEPAWGLLRDAIILSPRRVKVKIIEDYGIVDRGVLEGETRRERERMKLREASEKKEWLETYLERYRRRRKN